MMYLQTRTSQQHNLQKRNDLILLSLIWTQKSVPIPLRTVTTQMRVRLSETCTNTGAASLHDPPVSHKIHNLEHPQKAKHKRVLTGVCNPINKPRREIRKGKHKKLVKIHGKETARLEPSYVNEITPTFLATVVCATKGR